MASDSCSKPAQASWSRSSTAAATLALKINTLVSQQRVEAAQQLRLVGPSLPLLVLLLLRHCLTPAAHAISPSFDVSVGHNHRAAGEHILQQRASATLPAGSPSHDALYTMSHVPGHRVTYV